MTDKEMKTKMVKHLTRLLIEENVTGASNSNAIKGAIESYKALGIWLSPFSIDNIEWACLDEIDIDTGEVLNSYPLEPTKKDLVEIALKRQITRKQLEILKFEWRAFYNEPLKYQNFVSMTNMINQFIDDNK